LSWRLPVANRSVNYTSGALKHGLQDETWHEQTKRLAYANVRSDSKSKSSAVRNRNEQALSFRLHLYLLVLILTASADTPSSRYSYQRIWHEKS